MMLVTVLILIILLLLITLVRMLSKPKTRVNQLVSRRSWRIKVPSTFSRSEKAQIPVVDRQEPIVNSDPGPEQQQSVATSVSDTGDTENADDILGLNDQQPSAEPVTQKKQQPPMVAAPIVTLTLFAPSGRAYGGYELLQALLSNGLRFGKQQIFHRHKSKQMEGDILFSCASIVKPGTFDLAKMGGFSTPGLVLFLDTHEVKDPKAAFEIMLQTVDGIVEDLGGTVCDADQNIFTKQSLLNIHHKIEQYVRSCHTQDLFASP